MRAVLFTGENNDHQESFKSENDICDGLDNNRAGLALLEIIDKYDAVAGIDNGTLQ